MSFQSNLQSFCESVEIVRSAYAANGPGRIDARLQEPVVAAESALMQSLADYSGQITGVTVEQVETWVRKSVDLSKRCACQPNGLCFVTGEAGLIPRRDLEEDFETAIQGLREVCRQLEDVRASCQD